MLARVGLIAGHYSHHGVLDEPLRMHWPSNVEVELADDLPRLATGAGAPQFFGRD